MHLKKNMLILGGTKFIGRNLVESLLLRNDVELTLFNRGASNPGLFKGLRLIRGDRANTKDIVELRKEHWDVVIDLSCYFPVYLEHLLPVLEKNTTKIIFISSITAYDLNADSTYTTEHSALKVCPEELRNDTSWSSYGFRKAACEQLIQQCSIPQKIILRPAIAYGAHDLLDRFYYWIYKIKFLEEIIVPENGKDIANYTYVKDLVRIIVQLISLELEHEIFNVPTHDPISLNELVQTIMHHLQQHPRVSAIPSSFLMDQGLVPRVDIPLWNNGNAFSFDNSKIKKHMPEPFYTFSESIRETISFYDTTNWRMYKEFLSIENERELVKKFRGSTIKQVQ
jgi:2'-hydroxyisoflavone reductase